jgi:Protein of unknown function (DUF3429)
MARSIPAAPLILGTAGLLPPLLGAIVSVTSWDGWGTFASHLTVTYAAVILSFLGGSWWAFASREDTPQWPLLLLAVTPSLAAWLLLEMGLRHAQVGLAALILASPLVDGLLARRGLTPSWWMRLRVPLSVALALLTGLAAA